MKLRNKKPALLLIDIQKGFLNEGDWGGNRNNKNAEEVCGHILNKWRELSLPIFHIRHSSRNGNSKLHCQNIGFEFHESVLPKVGEPVITKEVNSAFIGTDLKQQLDTQEITALVIIGLTTNHCISTTARMAGNFDYETYVISDATATFNRVGIHGEVYDSEIIHLTSLASLNKEFATVWDFEKLIKQI